MKVQGGYLGSQWEVGREKGKVLRGEEDGSE
jgi:hypothetical protein